MIFSTTATWPPVVEVRELAPELLLVRRAWPSLYIQPEPPAISIHRFRIEVPDETPPRSRRAGRLRRMRAVRFARGGRRPPGRAQWLPPLERAARGRALPRGDRPRPRGVVRLQERARWA